MFFSERGSKMIECLTENSYRLTSSLPCAPDDPECGPDKWCNPDCSPADYCPPDCSPSSMPEKDDCNVRPWG